MQAQFPTPASLDYEPAQVAYLSRVKATSKRIMILMEHRISKDELLIDALLSDDSFASVCQLVRMHYPAYAIVESWEASDSDF